MSSMMVQGRWTFDTGEKQRKNVFICSLCLTLAYVLVVCKIDLVTPTRTPFQSYLASWLILMKPVWIGIRATYRCHWGVAPNQLYYLCNWINYMVIGKVVVVVVVVVHDSVWHAKWKMKMKMTSKNTV